MQILRISNRTQKLKDQPYGSGGYNRTLQIQEILEEANIRIADFDKSFLKTTLADRLFHGIQLVLKHQFSLRFSPRMLSKVGYIYHQALRNFKDHKGDKVVLIEEPPDYVAYCVAKELGFRVISVPHNLETLYPGYNRDFFTHQKMPHLLENEIMHLGKSDSIFAISREEQWLIKIRTGNCDFLPYYPPRYMKAQMEKVREERFKRVQEHPKRYLIISTIHNPPTVLSFYEHIEWLKSAVAGTDIQVDIAGYGTEQLQKSLKMKDSNFSFHGTVTPGKLQTLMIGTSGLLVHQTTGVGAITKIPEALIAGVPVICNAHSGRSAYHYPGVYIYESRQELKRILDQDLPFPPQPEKPGQAEVRFIAAIKD